MILTEEHKRVLSILDYYPKNLLSFTREYSRSFPLVWEDRLKNNGEEDTSKPPRKSMQEMYDYLTQLEEYSIVVAVGNNMFSKSWRISDTYNPHEEELVIKMPRKLKRLFTQLSNNAKIDLNTAVVNALGQYSAQRILSAMTVVDILKVIIVDNFGADPFSKEEVFPFLKNAGIYTMVDVSLDAYCVNICGNSGEDLFLRKLDNGEYKINAK